MTSGKILITLLTVLLNAVVASANVSFKNGNFFIEYRTSFILVALNG